MNRYNPYNAPNADAWLDMDEQMRIHLVETYHRRKRISLPSPTPHAAFHVIVENQLATGVTAVVKALARLQEEGLDRHDAIHAIASVLAEMVHGALGGAANPPAPYGQQEYEDRLKMLTAKGWRTKYGGG